MTTSRKTETANAGSLDAVVGRHPVTITDYLNRMTSDADAVRQRLLDAPIGLTGREEPDLWKIICDIRNQLAAARTLWK